MLPVAILAGGLATRIRPLTLSYPKALIEIAGKPFLHYQLSYLRSQGVNDVIICVGHLAELIKDYVGNGSNWGLKVDYSFDGDSLLGTGGALKKAIPLLGENFIILYGDSYLPIEFKKVVNAYFQSGNLGLMTVFNNKNQWDKSNVFFENGYVVDYSKDAVNSNMHYIDYGLGILSADAFKFMPDQHPFDLSRIYNRLINMRQLVGFEIFERFFEIGSHQGIADFEAFLLKHPIGNMQ
jgi:MurNAc alpha-1-phosphate uridylyltransferase